MLHSITRISLITIAMTWSCLALSLPREIYPTKVPNRLFGHLQGSTGSCMAEAEVAALEHAFAYRGYPVKLSTYYRHFINWKDKPQKDLDQGDVNIVVNKADQNLASRFGALLPHFMYPEDGFGLAPNRGDVVRPHISEAVLVGSNWPHSKQFGFANKFYTFATDYGNTRRDINFIKQQVYERKAVTLSLHSALLFESSGFFNEKTGLLKKPYRKAELIESLKDHDRKFHDGTSHAVAIIGYDDSLYKDHGYPFGPGAFIVRNSWNELNARREQMLDIPEELKSDHQRMRGKISSTALPGYYAIPYQYVIDLINSKNPSVNKRTGTAGFRVLTLNYDAFAAEYFRHVKEYQILELPYTCSLYRLREQAMEITEIYESIKDIRYAGDPQERKKLRRQLLSLIYQQMFGGWMASTRFAKLSLHNPSGQSQEDDLYSGRFSDFYCPNGTIWPTKKIASEPEFQELIQRFSNDAFSLPTWIKYFQFVTEYKPDRPDKIEFH